MKEQRYTVSLTDPRAAVEKIRNADDLGEGYCSDG